MHYMYFSTQILNYSTMLPYGQPQSYGHLVTPGKTAIHFLVKKTLVGHPLIWPIFFCSIHVGDHN